VISVCRSYVRFDVTQTKTSRSKHVYREGAASKHHSIAFLSFEENPEPVIVHAIQTLLIGCEDKCRCTSSKINTRGRKPKRYIRCFINAAHVFPCDFLAHRVQDVPWDSGLAFEALL